MKTYVAMKYVGVLVGCFGWAVVAGCSEPAKISPTCDQAQVLVGCDVETCVDGEVTAAPAEAGTACAVDNGHVCDGASHCVECLQGADCATGVCNDNMCGAPLCGDDIVSAGEACDDGNVVSGDGCEANCTVTGCGNGIVAGAEACDDGNTNNGDGCSAACEFEGCPATGPSSMPCDVGNGFVRHNNGYQAKSAEIQIDTAADVTIRIGRRDPAMTATQLALHTATVTRGGVTLSDAAPTVAERSDRLVFHRGQIDEEITTAPAGIEQRWTFAAAPAGQGDVLVRVAVDNAEPGVVVDERGFHFGHDLAGGTYSHATWVDAAGIRTAITGQWQNGAIEFAVPDALLASSTFPAVLDPSISFDYVLAIDTEVTSSPTGAASEFAQVAWSGTNYLVVWRDNRLSRNSDIYAARLSATGTLLDTPSILVSSTAGIQSAPAVAFINGNFVVVWEDYKLPAGDADLRAARISTAGAVTQLGTVAVTTTAETHPLLASRGTEGLLVFARGPALFASRYNGTTFGAAFSVAAAGSEYGVAANPAGEYLVTYAAAGTTGLDVKGQRITAAGALSGTAFDIAAGATDQRMTSAAFVGGNFAVAFSSGSDIWGTRVSTAGAVLDTHTEGTVTTVGGKKLIPAVSSQEYASLACNTTCMIAWQDRRDFATRDFDSYARAFDATLTATGAETLLATTGALRNQSSASVAAGATNFFAVWNDLRDATVPTVYGSPLSTAGALSIAGGIVVPRSVNRQQAPAVAAAPSGSGHIWSVTWGDSKVAGDNIVGERFDANTVPIGGVANISTAAATQQTPISTFDGTNFVNAWSDIRGTDFDVYLARTVPTTGALLDATGIALSTAAKDQFVTGAASNGAGLTLIVWQDRRNGNFDIYGAIVNSSGTIVASDIVISNAGLDQISARAAWDSTNNVFLVVWSDARAGTVGGRDIYGARVNAAGIVLDAAGVVLSNGANSQVTPDVAFANGRFLVVWDDRRTDAGDIYGTRVRVVSGALSVDDPAGRVYSNAAAGQSRPSISSTRRPSTGNIAFILAWTDERNLATTAEDIYGAIVNSTTGVRVGADFVIANGAGADTRVSLMGGLYFNLPLGLYAYNKVIAGSSTIRVRLGALLYSATEI